MICAIMQPTYFPWVGYFDLIDQCEEFILYDDVQLTKRSWQVRNRIKTSNGELLLTIPVKKTKSRDEITIHKAEINYNENWENKHLKSLKNAYLKAPYFDEIFPKFEEIYKIQNQYLGEFNILLITFIAQNIGIIKEFKLSSSLKGIVGKKDARLTSLCKTIGADSYLSPQGSASYIESSSPGGNLAENNIDVYYHNYEHPVYNQMHGDFIPYMGIIDLLFNIGFENALTVIRSGRKLKYSSKEFREKFMTFP